MQAGNPREREASIVLVGDFDPLLLVPQWFINNKLLPEEDAVDNVAIEIVYKDLTRFTLPNITVEIQPSRVVLRSDRESLDFMIVDLAVGILTILNKVQITALGLNVFEDYEFEDNAVWNEVGDILAPKGVWSEILPETPKAGLQNLQIQIRKPIRERGVYNFNVSWLERHGWTRFQTNDHYESGQKPVDGNGLPLKGVSFEKFDPVKLISAGWDSRKEFHLRAVQTLIARAEKEVADGRR
ncbi:hypothetical protein [Pseudomonas juntendi]|uniref:Uncharacterized protein n=1 Tax=Pseudomonas juntendi TaxID=2666183 RepID=A0A7W2JFL9_9PSED|nr:hypothetical protein [Pseudomonas juntendi]MBA6058062.1 hypothetical protein [Pseudomonas juntendi]MBA6126558.1 hypothetical protein [Pseudomonas juntendi]